MARQTITPVRRRRLSARDLRALAFVGRGYEVMQYQLHDAVFRGHAPNVVSRFVSRASRRGYLVAERLQAVGMNRLRLTADGVHLVAERGIAKADSLFAPRRSVPLKDLAHTVWINDLRCALLRSAEPPDVISPAWLLQRRLQPVPRAIPDVLAIWKPSGKAEGLLLGCEVDLGGESVRGTFAPKLCELADELDSWAGNSPAALLVLTTSVRRAELIRHHMPDWEPSDRVGVVTLLPSESGVSAIAALQVATDDAFLMKQRLGFRTSSEATGR